MPLRSSTSVIAVISYMERDCCYWVSTVNLCQVEHVPKRLFNRPLSYPCLKPRYILRKACPTRTWFLKAVRISVVRNGE